MDRIERAYQPSTPLFGFLHRAIELQLITANQQLANLLCHLVTRHVFGPHRPFVKSGFRGELFENESQREEDINDASNNTTAKSHG